jgi:opacity protein-like surface antigen
MIPRLVPALSTLLLTSGVLGAQQEPTTAPAPSPHRWVLSAGVDAVSEDDFRYRPGGTIHAGYERRIGASRIGVRLAGDYWRQSEQQSAQQSAQLDRAAYRVTDRVLGASALATVALRQGGQFRPYLLSGVGVHHLTQRITGARTEQNGSDPELPVRVREMEARFSPSVTAGAGMDASLGRRAAVFLELRGVLLPSGGRSSLESGTHPVRGLLLPLTFGVRL